MNAPKRNRIPSKSVVLPPGKAFFAVTAPDKAENKFDPENLQWSIRVVWEGDQRKAVEQLLGPMLPDALDAKRAELMAEAEAAGDMIKKKKAEAMDYETPWREVLSKETGEATGEIEIVFKRPAFKTDRFTKSKVANSPPLVVDALRKPTTTPIPNRAIVQVKMATWPVYFVKDNMAGIKKLLEAVQVISMPEARRPDASGFEDHDEGFNGDSEGTPPEGSSPVANGADY